MEGIGLGGRSNAAHRGRSEYIRPLQFCDKGDDRLLRIGHHLHFKKKPALGVDGGADREYAHVGWGDRVQIGEYLGPADRFSADQRIEQNAAIENNLIAGLTHGSVELTLLTADRSEERR